MHLQGVVFLAHGQEWFTSVCQTLTQCVLVGHRSLSLGQSQHVDYKNPPILHVSVFLLLSQQHILTHKFLLNCFDTQKVLPIPLTTMISVAIMWMVLAQHMDRHDNMCMWNYVASLLQDSYSVALSPCGPASTYMYHTFLNISRLWINASLDYTPGINKAALAINAGSWTNVGRGKTIRGIHGRLRYFIM